MAQEVGLKELLEGPTAMTFVRGDAAAAAKALSDFRRASGGTLLEFKGGWMNGAALTPATPSVPGLTTPAATGVNPALTSPDPLTSTTGLGLANEQPISAPIGLDPMAGTYPILGGDPSLSTAAPASGGGGLVSDLSSAAQQLGAGQAIDLLKGVLMPTIMSAIQSAAPAAQAAAAAPAAAAPAA